MPAGVSAGGRAISAAEAYNKIESDPDVLQAMKVHDRLAKEAESYQTILREGKSYPGQPFDLNRATNRLNFANQKVKDAWDKVQFNRSKAEARIMSKVK